MKNLLVTLLSILTCSVALAASPSPFIFSGACASGIYNLPGKTCYTAGGGASQTLNNLTNPTAINQNLVFDAALSPSISSTKAMSLVTTGTPATVVTTGDCSTTRQTLLNVANTTGIVPGMNVTSVAGSIASGDNVYVSNVVGSTVYIGVGLCGAAGAGVDLTFTAIAPYKNPINIAAGLFQQDVVDGAMFSPAEGFFLNSDHDQTNKPPFILASTSTGVAANDTSEMLMYSGNQYNYTGTSNTGVVHIASGDNYGVSGTTGDIQLATGFSIYLPGISSGVQTITTGAINAYTGTVQHGAANSGAMSFSTGNTDSGTPGNIGFVAGTSNSGGHVGKILFSGRSVDISGVLNMPVYGAGQTPGTGLSPSPIQDGSMAFTSAHILCVYNGSAWKRASDGSTACTF